MSLTRILSAVLVSGALFVAVPAEAKMTTTPAKSSVVRHETKKAHKKAHKKASKKSHKKMQKHMAKAAKKASKTHKVA